MQNTSRIKILGTILKKGSVIIFCDLYFVIYVHFASSSSTPVRLDTQTTHHQPPTNHQTTKPDNRNAGDMSGAPRTISNVHAPNVRIDDQRSASCPLHFSGGVVLRSSYVARTHAGSTRTPATRCACAHMAHVRLGAQVVLRVTRTAHGWTQYLPGIAAGYQARSGYRHAVATHSEAIIVKPSSPHQKLPRDASRTLPHRLPMVLLHRSRTRGA